MRPALDALLQQNPGTPARHIRQTPQNPRQPQPQQDHTRAKHREPLTRRHLHAPQPQAHPPARDVQPPPLRLDRSVIRPAHTYRGQPLRARPAANGVRTAGRRPAPLRWYDPRPLPTPPQHSAARRTTIQQHHPVLGAHRRTRQLPPQLPHPTRHQQTARTRTASMHRRPLLPRRRPPRLSRREHRRHTQRTPLEDGQVHRVHPLIGHTRRREHRPPDHLVGPHPEQGRPHIRGSPRRPSPIMVATSAGGHRFTRAIRSTQDSNASPARGAVTSANRRGDT